MSGASGNSGALSESQISDFWESGFVAVEGVLSDAEMSSLSAAFDAPEVAAELASHGYADRGVHLLGAVAKHPALREIARSPAIIDRVVQLLGEDLQLQHSKLATKPPTAGLGRFEWHQDFAFFPHTNTDLAAVMVYLDDATAMNGCMSVIPGSHRQGLREHRIDGWFTGCCTEQAWDGDEPALLEMKASGITIHHCLTLHSSEPNRSADPRRTLVLQYRAADAHQLADEVFPETGWQVHGAYSGRVRCEAGAWNLPRWPDKGFGRAWTHVGELAAAWNGPETLPPPDAARAVQFAP